MDKMKSTDLNLLNEDHIKAELSRLLASKQFRSADQMSRFLRFVVSETLAGREDSLETLTIANRALHISDGLPIKAREANVRVCASRVRRALHTYYEINRNSPIRVSLPVGRYRAVFESEQVIKPSKPKRTFIDPQSGRKIIIY